MTAKSILVVSPHPDDESIGCGGTLRSHVLNGDHVKVVFLTSGENGGHGRSADETRTLREQEARAASEVLGFEDIEFWRLGDGAVSSEPLLVERMTALIAAVGPARIYVPYTGDMHPDHRSAAEVVQKSLASLDEAVLRPECLMYEVWTPMQHVDVINDITQFIETKRLAIQTYRSQCAEVAFDDAIIGLNRYRGELYSWPEGEYAEVFQLLK